MPQIHKMSTPTKSPPSKKSRREELFPEESGDDVFADAVEPTLKDIFNVVRKTDARTKKQTKIMRSNYEHERNMRRNSRTCQKLPRTKAKDSKLDK